MHSFYTVFDYGMAAAAGNVSGSKQGGPGGTVRPRVGIGKLNAAEQAAAEALFNQALGSVQSSGARLTIYSDVPGRRMVLLFLFLACALVWQ